MRGGVDDLSRNRSGSCFSKYRRTVAVSVATMTSLIVPPTSLPLSLNSFNGIFIPCDTVLPVESSFTDPIFRRFGVSLRWNTYMIAMSTPHTHFITLRAKTGGGVLRVLIQEGEDRFVAYDRIVLFSFDISSLLFFIIVVLLITVVTSSSSLLFISSFLCWLLSSFWGLCSLVSSFSSSSFFCFSCKLFACPVLFFLSIRDKSTSINVVPSPTE
mmetsp:Transcript_29607/g.47462  ORF Transcript_29607/g.47462 Transcript_29607/m.47462 type:complete len:214 (-) Transcript_29607:863-1504(-)